MHITLRSGFAALALALTLAACGQPATPAPTQAPAVTAPAATEPPAQTPAQVPTAAATTEPIAANLLPAPLLFITERNELAQIAVDGETITTLTSEDSLIIDFAVGPNGGPLAFVTVSEGDQRATLVRINADGTGRTELASGTIRGVSVAADGSVQAGALFATTRADGVALAAGTWNFPLDGGEPTLLAAGTDPAADASGNVNPGVHYQPLAWSPDGSALLLHTSMNMGPDGPGGDIGTNGLALYDSGTSQARDLLPIGQEWVCAEPAWGRDSASVLCANNAAIGAPTPALWRLRLADGGQEAIIPAAEPLTTTFSPRELPEGLYVLAGSYQDSGLALMPQRIPPGSTTIEQLSLPIQTGFDGGLWAPDGSGVVFGRPNAGANRTIVWQPLGEAAPVELLSGSIGRLAWATR